MASWPVARSRIMPHSADNPAQSQQLTTVRCCCCCVLFVFESVVVSISVARRSLLVCKSCPSEVFITAATDPTPYLLTTCALLPIAEKTAKCVFPHANYRVVNQIAATGVPHTRTIRNFLLSLSRQRVDVDALGVPMKGDR